MTFYTYLMDSRLDLVVKKIFKFLKQSQLDIMRGFIKGKYYIIQMYICYMYIYIY